MQNAASRFLIVICGLLFFLGNPQWSQANTASQLLVTQGRAQLFNGGELTVSGLLTARGLFAAAVDEDDGDQEAQAFYGFTHALAFLFEDGATGGIDTLKELFEAFGVTRTGNEGIDMELFSGLPTFDNKYDPPVDLPDGETVQVFVQGPLLTRLGEVFGALNTVGSGFAVSVTAAETGDEPLNIDYADIQVLRAWVNAARTFALIVSAYDLSFDLNDLVQLINADMLQLQRDLLVRYPTLLQLRPEGAGAANLLAAEQALQNAINDYRDAHDYIVDRITNHADWRADHLFSFDSLAEANTSGFFVTRMEEIQAALNEDRPASLISVEQTWTLTESLSGNQMVIEIEKDQQGNIQDGEWHGLNGCTAIGCGGTVQDVDINGQAITIVLTDDYCDTEVTLSGTIGENFITGGYTGNNCGGPISGTFDGNMTAEETLTDVINVNRIFGTGTTPQPLDIRSVLPDFHVYNEPIIDSFPGSPILNGILPIEPQIVTNEDATRHFELMPNGEFPIPQVSNGSITIGAFAAWDEAAKVFDDISQDDPEESYNGHEDLKSFWMAADSEYYYMRAVYNDGAAALDTFPQIHFFAKIDPEGGAMYGASPYCTVYPYENGGTVYFGRMGWSYNSSTEVRSGTCGSDACVEWRVPKTDLDDLSGRFIQIDAGFNKDHNPTFKQFPGYTLSGTIAIDGYTSGKILLYLYDGPDPDYSELLASAMIDEQGAFTIEGLANMDETICWLYAVWDVDGNGIVNVDDVYGSISGQIQGNIMDADVLVDQLIDFTVEGSVMNVHKPDGTFATYLEAYIDGFDQGILPDDIDSITYEGPGGIITTLDDPNIDITHYGDSACSFFVEVPGQPTLGTYTFTVTSGNAVRAVTDTQTVIREVPLPDVSSFLPQPWSIVTSMTPTFSWDPVFYENIPLYYRLQIQDAWGNLVVNTGRTLNMTSYTVPAGALNPGQNYSWRVRVTDSGNWVAVENRSHSAWQPFTTVSAFASPAMPAVDLDNWGVVMYRTSDYTGFDLSVKVIDHDGVVFNGETGFASHSVIAHSPAGDAIVLNFDYAESATAGYFYSWFTPDLSNLEQYEGDWTFVVTDSSGNTASVVDSLAMVPLPFPDPATFQPADGDTVADTTPTFTWHAVSGTNADRVKRYRVRIHTEDLSGTVWKGYTGTETSYTVPPGVLAPNTTYRYRIDAYDAHSGFDNDNVSRAPADGNDYLRFTTGDESPDPYIDLDSTGVETWNGSGFGPTLSFWVRVFDPQGVPGDIESVKAILPGGKEVSLRYQYNANATSAYYSTDTFDPAISDTYTLRVEDREGNAYETTEDLNSDPIGFPAESSFTPIRSSLIGSTAVDFDWEDVPDAAFYRLEIYDENFNRIYRFATTESQFSLPEGYLAEGTYYAYRITTRREFFDENVDNGSSSPWFGDNRFNFITTATAGSAPPSIDTDNWGALLWHFPRPDDPNTSGYWMAFNVRVTDADGPPHAIQRVEVTAPDGTTFPDGTTTRSLSFDGKSGVDSAYYWYMENIAVPTQMPEGTYTFTVTDVNGNTDTVTDDFVRDPLPSPTGLLPLPDADVSGTTPTISWNPVAGAANYRLEIYNEAGSRIHRPFLEGTSYTVPEGILELNKTYSYRVRAHREDPQTVEMDNISSSTWFDGLRPYFTTRPMVDSDSDGILDAVEDGHACLDPLDADTDNDGLLDGVEDANRDGFLDAYETNPCVWDTDDDGMGDGYEVNYALDPLVPDEDDDPDGDLFTNYMESLFWSNPRNIYDYPSLSNGFDGDMDVDGLDLYHAADGVARGVFDALDVGEFADAYGH